jgi:hypothetical protein
LEAIANLPLATIASDAEVLHFIRTHNLSGRGVGYVDAHLLAAVRLTSGATLWSLDKRLQVVAGQLRLSS